MQDAHERVQACQLHKAGHVQDEYDLPIAQNGGPGKACDRLQVLSQGLHHNLFGVMNGVHDQADLVRPGLHYNDEGAGRGFAAQAQCAVQKAQRQDSLPQPVHRRPAKLFDRVGFGNSFQAHHFRQVHLWNREALSGTADDQHRNHGQGQRDLDAHSRSLTDDAFQIYRATDLFDVRSYHVQANPAARNTRHLFGGGESRGEYQPGQFRLAHFRRPFGGDQSPFEGALPHPGQVDAGAVVGNLNMHSSLPMVGTNAQMTSRGLSGAGSLFRGLDAMIDGVAQDVGERVLDGFDHSPVQLCL